jgi:hypothetical protein
MSLGWKLIGVIFIDSSQQGFNLSLYMSSMVKVTQVIRSELVF